MIPNIDNSIMSFPYIKHKEEYKIVDRGYSMHKLLLLRRSSRFCAESASLIFRSDARHAKS